jgi:hypothetical protein
MCFGLHDIERLLWQHPTNQIVLVVAKKQQHK